MVLLKEYCPIWPPDITIRHGAIPPHASVEDTVFSVQKCANPINHLGLDLRTKSGAEYMVTVPVPSSLQESILFSIIRKKDITLGEVGDLPFELPSVRPIAHIRPIRLKTSPK
jgi:hypothetical protein